MSELRHESSARLMWRLIRAQGHRLQEGPLASRCVGASSAPAPLGAPEHSILPPVPFVGVCERVLTCETVSACQSACAS